MSTTERIERLAKRLPARARTEVPAHLLPPAHKPWSEHLRGMSDEGLHELCAHFKQVAPERQANLESLSDGDLHAMLGKAL